MTGHVRKRRRANGSTAWQVRWVGEGRQEVTRTFDRRKDADEWLQDQRAAKLRGDLISPEMQTMTVAELAAEWRATWPGRLQPTTQARADQVLSTYVIPSLGPERASTLSHSRVSAFLANLPSHLSPATVRKVHATLSACFTQGIRAGHVRDNPCRYQRLPRVHRQERTIIGPEQAAELADRCAAMPGGGETARVAVLLAFYTGLRAGEQWALRWSDLSDGRLVIRRALKSVRGVLEFGPTKTHAIRSVSLPDHLLSALERLPRYEIASKTAATADLLIFRGAYGKPIRHNLFLRRVFRPACEAMGLDDLRWHDLRHSHGSLLLARGVPIHVVKERLGHASIQTTVDVYGHLVPGADDEVARLLDAA